MNALQIIFWIGLAVVIYAYAGYPLVLALLARLRPRALAAALPAPRSCSIILPAHNEQTSLDRRLRELVGHIQRAGLDAHVIVVSDGSTDATPHVASAYATQNVRVMELRERSGKAAALNEGCAAATGDILVFADTRQRWDEGALPALLECFRDPGVGAASGELLLEQSPGVLAGVGLYWRYEKAIRRLESATGSVCGVTGAISAVRRELYQPLPRGTLLDDLHWPLRVVMQGQRVVFQPEAKAYDRLPDRPRDEFRRKVRTLCGNYQLLLRMPSAACPIANPGWWRLISHKLCRLLVPWALLAMLASSILLPGAFYSAALAVQLAGYGVAAAALLAPRVGRYRMASAAGAFLVLNAAAFLALFVWIAGRSGRSWKKAAYAAPPRAAAA